MKWCGLWAIVENSTPRGMVPVNTTQNPFVHSQWENDWRYLPFIKALTALAALFHDLGKASVCFQEKLMPKSANKMKADPLRHEWVSILLFDAAVDGGTDEQWLRRLSNGGVDEALLKNTASLNTETALEKLPPLAGLIAWLIISHHRLPFTPSYKEWRGEPAATLSKMLKRVTRRWGYENRRDELDFKKRLPHCLDFPSGFPTRSKQWAKQSRKWAVRMLACLPSVDQTLKDGSWRLVLHHSRLSLMLGDHGYSSQEADRQWLSDCVLVANTHRDGRKGHRKGSARQKLDEHLVGVMKSSLRTAHLLPAFEFEPPHAHDIKSLRKKSPPVFKWQDKAVEKVKAWKLASKNSNSGKPQGFIAVNMASTGCGKTYANAKIMRVLSEDGESLRYILALGLRALTLQTGDEYRERVGMDNSELAVLIGSKAVMELHRENRDDIKGGDAGHVSAGSESSEELFEDDVVDYNCAIPEGGLNTVLTGDRERKFLYSPVLACTIDHIMAATECRRGGRYILPSLRLMSSDLVIDEVDDFSGKDLIAIGRLVHMAGMLGRKVMISSATIPPALAEGYFNVYREGWRLYSKTRDVVTGIGCAWIDEYGTKMETMAERNADKVFTEYKGHHNKFVGKRVERLKTEAARRKAEIIDCGHIERLDGNDAEDGGTVERAFFETIGKAVVDKHLHHHCIDPDSKKRVSFGVVRVANIDPCVALTEYLANAVWPENIDIRVMAYHSRQVLLRSEQENHLDRVLKRSEGRNAVPAAFGNPVVRRHLDCSEASNVIFILVATPVEEVGRDHDFDWAVVAPSSLRSIIQLAGRVLRHRAIEPKTPNIALMQYNLKALRMPCGTPVYCRPGYELGKRGYRLSSRDLSVLIDGNLLSEGISAIPRIQCGAELKSTEKLADLEHFSIAEQLTNYAGQGPETMQGWLTQCWWMTALPQRENPFREGGRQVKLYLVPQNDDLKFLEKDSGGHMHEAQKSRGIHTWEMPEETSGKLWLQRDYRLLLESCAERQDISDRLAAMKYGEISLPVREDGMNGQLRSYRYSSQLGLSSLMENHQP